MTESRCSRAEIVEGGVFVPTAGIGQSVAIRDLIIAAPYMVRALHAVAARMEANEVVGFSVDDYEAVVEALIRAGVREGMLEGNPPPNPA